MADSRKNEWLAAARGTQRSTFNVQRSAFNVRSLSAFTLLEVLLAITITGFVLAAASTMLVSVTNIWANRQEINFFEDHVDGVAEFLQSCFTNAGTEIALGTNDESTGGETSETVPEGESPAETPTLQVNVGSGTNNGSRTSSGDQSSSDNKGLLRVSDNPVGWATPPGFASFRDPSLNFKLKDTPPLMINTDNAPVVGIDAFLHFDEKEGLSLLWYSILQEEVEDENDMRRTLISPYVTQIKYIYWDEQFERWEEEDEPQEGEADDEFLLPRFIKLIFEHDGATKERTISIPVPSRSALIF